MLSNWSSVFSQGAGVKAPCRSMFLPAPDIVGLAASHPACLTAHIPTHSHQRRPPSNKIICMKRVFCFIYTDTTKSKNLRTELIESLISDPQRINR